MVTLAILYLDSRKTLELSFDTEKGEKGMSRITCFVFMVKTYEPRHEISNNVVCATSKGSDQPVHTHILIRAFASHLNIV